MGLTGPVTGAVTGQVCGSVLRPPWMGGLARKFFADAPNLAGVIQLQVKGVGTPATDHLSDLWRNDHEDAPRMFGQDELVVERGRVVRNLSNGLALVAGGTTPPTATDEGEDVTKIVFPAGSDVGITGCYAKSAPFDTTSIPSGGTSINRFSVKLSRSLVGSEDIVIIPALNTHVTLISLDSASPDLTEYEILSSDRQSVTVTSANTSFIVYVNTVLLSPLTVWIKERQVEDGTGRTDTTNPSEYIKTTTAPVQKVFSYANGNTVDGNGVVTEAKGADLAPQPQVPYSPNAINLCLTGTQTTAQTATLTTTGKVTLKIFGPVGSTATVAAGTATGTGWGTAVLGTPIELDITGAGTVTITAVTPEAINLIEQPLADVRYLGPIYTSGAEQSISEHKPTFATDNYKDTASVLTFEWTPSFSTSEKSGGIPIIALNGGAGLLYYDATNSLLKSTDGTNIASKALTVVHGTTYKIGVVWHPGDSKMSVGEGGAWGSDATYDGAFAVGSVIEQMQTGRLLQRWGGNVTYAVMQAKGASLTGA